MTLHTKYRPTKLMQVVGQDAAVKAFGKLLESKRSQTFLLHGPSGTGKTTLARIGASMVGSEERDIVEIDGATHTGIDAMREVIAKLRYRSFGESGVRSIILDEAHALSAQAWKALLKNLEEPSPHVFWFLCTTELGKVPANIKTRCSAIELDLVEPADIEELLRKVAAKEKIDVSEGVIELCAKEALGSPRQGLVNLGVCAEVDNVKEAAGLLRSAIESPQVVELARALLSNAPWSKIKVICSGLKEQNAESVRQVIRGYMTSVALSADGKVMQRAMEILDVFDHPFHSGDGISPIVLGCGRLLP